MTDRFIELVVIRRSSLYNMLRVGVKEGVVPQSMLHLFQEQVNGVRYKCKGCQLNFKIIIYIFAYIGDFYMMRANAKS
jgi:hypothetical protein